MATLQKMDRKQMSQQNKRLVFECIQRNGPINRAAIAKQTRLSLPSIMSITEGFIELGVVRTAGKAESHGGKRPELLELCADYGYTIGLDVGRSTLRVVVCDMSGTILCNLKEPTKDVIPPEQLVDRMCHLINCSIEKANIDCKKIIGVGVAMPGLIDRKNGHVLFSPDFKWSSVPLRNWLCQRLPYPVIVENSNMAYAISDSIQLSNYEEKLFYVNLGYGIGGAMILNGAPYYGSSGTSGEIGHMVVERDGPMCTCGNNGCLEAMASGAAIANQAHSAVSSGVYSSLSNFNPEQIEAKTVFDAAKEGDRLSCQIVNKAVLYISIGIANIINLLDPDRVILFGGLTANGPIFLDPLETEVKRRQMHQAGKNTLIEIRPSNDWGVAFGAANMVYLNREMFPAFSFIN